MSRSLGSRSSGIGVGRDVEIRSVDGPLRAADAEELGERLQQRRLAGRVRADQGGDVGADRTVIGSGPKQRKPRG